MLDFRTMTADQKQEMVEELFRPLESSEDVKDWVRFFLDLEIPLEITDPDSTSSPLDAIWKIYETFKNNSGDVNPGYILMSCREGMKTVSVALLELLLLLHFQLDIAHAAAVESQSEVAIQYIGGFLSKIEPLLEQAGWGNDTQNKRTIRFTTPQNKKPFIKILICTPKGMNSLHANVIFLDELDLADPTALKEAKNIVGYSKGIYGITVYLSTRKYSFGNMQAALDKAPETGYHVLQWNILDVTEACPPSRHQPDGPKRDMYVGKNLPLIQITPEDYEMLADVEKLKFDLIPLAHAGCIECKIFPVCRKRLSDKPQTATGGFYKPIVSVIQKFKDNDADVAEAQLMCWRPGSDGLVFPRFVNKVDNGNTISLNKAYEVLLGVPPQRPVDEHTILGILKSLKCPIHCGVDWGFTHDAVIVVAAEIPNGEKWIIDCWSAPGMEFSDILDVAMKYRDKYLPFKWWCDQAMPANIKSFNRNGMTSPKFTKDVPGGIEALRSKIVNASGDRYFKVLATASTAKVITAITKHRFMLDGQGNPTRNPDDEPGIADICDSLRYIAQNVFPVRGTRRPGITSASPQDHSAIIPKDLQYEGHQNSVMRQELAKAIGAPVVTGGSAKRGGFRFTW